MIDLKFDRVSKKYELRTPSNSPRRWYKQPFARRSSQMWALRDVSFEVKEGEALGIVGHNGAGKTTILKILSSITTPTQGEITVRGRLAALVEVSSGVSSRINWPRKYLSPWCDAGHAPGRNSSKAR